MKKQIITLTLLLLTLMVFGQYSSYDRGFKNGYSEGYCYNDFGCIAPIAPITPLPLIGESNENYQDGYNRGFKRGLEDKQTKKSNSGSGNKGKGANGLQQSQNANYILDYSSLISEMEIKQAQNEKNIQIKKEKAIANSNTIKSYYASLTKFPAYIPDGWYLVIATNNYDMCGEKKVYVENAKVTKYVLEDGINRQVSFCSIILNAKAMLQLVFDNGVKSEMLDVYFLDYINRNNYESTENASSTVGTGKVSFWTNLKRFSNISIYVDGSFIGILNQYFKEGTPNCEQSGTVTFKSKPGTYNYKEVSSELTWTGTITVEAGNCYLRGLSKN